MSVVYKFRPTITFQSLSGARSAPPSFVRVFRLRLIDHRHEVGGLLNVKWLTTNGKSWQMTNGKRQMIFVARSDARHSHSRAWFLRLRSKVFARINELIALEVVLLVVQLFVSSTRRH